MGFIVNSIRFLAVQTLRNRLRYDRVTENLKVENVFVTQCI